MTETAVYTPAATDQAYAYPIDGYAFGVAAVPSIAASTTSSPSSAATGSTTHTVGGE